MTAYLMILNDTTGHHLGQVFSFKCEHACLCYAIALIAKKQPNLKLKTKTKQLSGSLPLVFILLKLCLDS